ncbi:MAG: hypothetical protein ACW986_17285 [Promethearchaeota archaeon]|jgi:hypothetical protein
MEKREKNVITGVIVAVIGVIMILYSLNVLVVLFFAPYFLFITPFGYLYLNIFIIAFTSFGYAFFMIRPAKTQKVRNILAKIVLVVGIVLLIFPIIGMFLETYYSSTYYGFSFYIVGFFVPYLIVMIPGFALTIHGYFWRKETRGDPNEYIS